MKPRLLVVELWGMGDLVIATPFLQAASEKYEVTLVAKPYARDLQARFWRDVKVVSFVAPWTAFERKYYVLSWPWREMFRLQKRLKTEGFDYGISARWDPRDHFLLTVARAKQRLGFPRMRSQIFLTQYLTRPEPRSHRYESWRVMAKALGFTLPPRERLAMPQVRRDGEVLVHTGAGQPVRVWPLERYRSIVRRLREKGFHVQVACDPDQRTWWAQTGEEKLATPQSVGELLALVDRASVFIGNDSGPGHLSAFCGVPTFTLFGPQLAEWFAPLHPASEWLEGKACPYKPCSDYCRFTAPVCMTNSTEEEVWLRIQTFVNHALAPPLGEKQTGQTA